MQIHNYVFNLNYVILQLAIEAEILFDATIADMGVSIDYQPEGKDPLPTIVDYIENWRISAWEIAFNREFAVENGIHKNLEWKNQLNSKQALKRVIFRYNSFAFVIVFMTLNLSQSNRHRNRILKNSKILKSFENLGKMHNMMKN